MVAVVLLIGYKAKKSNWSFSPFKWGFKIMEQVSLVKADVRKNQWTEIIQACQSSGMTVKTCCAENGINIKSYYYRLRKLREGGLQYISTGSSGVILDRQSA